MSTADLIGTPVVEEDSPRTSRGENMGVEIRLEVLLEDGDEIWQIMKFFCEVLL